MNPMISKTDKKIPDIRPGDIVRVHQKIREGGKEREQAFEGVVIKKSGGSQPGASFVVRKISQGIGVERKFPIYSPSLMKIQVKKRSKVKRADLSYLRNVGQIKKKLKDRKVEPFEEKLVVASAEGAIAKDAKDENAKPAKEKAPTPSDQSIGKEKKDEKIKKEQEKNSQPEAKEKPQKTENKEESKEPQKTSQNP